MGKTRKSNKNTTPTTKEVEKPSQDQIYRMQNWQVHPQGSPDNKLLEEDIAFIKRNMKSALTDDEVPTNELTRVEEAYHFIDSGLKEGDILNTNSVFRGFSREPDATLEYMLYNMDLEKPIVIYRTHGDVKHYNITEHTKKYISEKESWVETGKLQIDKVTSYSGNENTMQTILKKELHLNNYPNSDELFEYYGVTPTNVTIVDVSPVK